MVGENVSILIVGIQGAQEGTNAATFINMVRVRVQEEQGITHKTRKWKDRLIAQNGERMKK